MSKHLLWGCLTLVILYLLIPSFLARRLGIGVFRKGRTAGQIAFTFDDGPDPSYTPQLLDLLKKHETKATFFVLGRKAEQYPDIIRRIHEEGHQLGIHNYTHHSNWFMTPWTITKRHIDHSATIVKRITGTYPTFYRPPWGMINIFDFLRLKKQTIVLWSVMASDWRSNIGPQRLKSVLLQNITSGSVILLHDSGDTFGANYDAPKYMMEALDEVLFEIKRQGLTCIRVDEMIAAEQKYRFPYHYE